MTNPFISFPALPRVKSTDVADDPSAQARFATAVDANFAMINPFATTFADPYKVTRTSGSKLITWATNWTWYSAAEVGVDGWQIGPLRTLAFIGKYIGAATINSDNYGGMSNQTMCTFNATTGVSFRPKEYTYIAAGHAAGVCDVAISPSSSYGIQIVGMGSGYQNLYKNDWVAFHVSYMVGS